MELADAAECKCSARYEVKRAKVTMQRTNLIFSHRHLDTYSPRTLRSE